MRFCKKIFKSLLSLACRVGLPSAVYIPCVVCMLLHSAQKVLIELGLRPNSHPKS